MSKLRANVWVGGTLYRKGGEVPADVAKQITNPKAWEDGTSPQADATSAKADTEVKEPPRGGPGSSADAWRTFMVAQGYEVPDDATAKDMQASWDARDRS